ncbi:TRIC cation channel family protein [Utexia brackfieldae]|uniref:TRIC cation channel family protein n=1 Tax=Utexia brackfieldae TaxID=3074108 RepID=UPI00370DA196
MSYIFWLDILGTAVFAISGVLLAARTQMDPIGALVLGVITAIGGGTIRDIILNNGPIFWVVDSTDLMIAIVASFFSMIFIRFTTFKYPRYLLSILDAIGLAVFVGIGVNKAIASHVNELVAVCMGVLTGVGGGVIRDVLAREIPMVFRVDIYATACIIGGVCHMMAYQFFSLPLQYATLFGIAVTLVIRLMAIFWHLKLPILSAKSGINRS